MAPGSRPGAPPRSSSAGEGRLQSPQGNVPCSSQAPPVGAQDAPGAGGPHPDSGSRRPPQARPQEGPHAVLRLRSKSPWSNCPTKLKLTQPRTVRGRPLWKQRIGIIIHSHNPVVDPSSVDARASPRSSPSLGAGRPPSLPRGRVFVPEAATGAWARPPLLGVLTQSSTLSPIFIPPTVARSSSRTATVAPEVLDAHAPPPQSPSCRSWTPTFPHALTRTLPPSLRRVCIEDGHRRPPMCWTHTLPPPR